MADVAARAGVSGQTVSRVVNGSPRVDPATRSRVTAAMDALGYRPHRAARALRTGRTQTLGLVATTLATTGNSRMLQAVADAATDRGYSLVVATLGGETIETAFERLRDQGVDGAIVLNEATASARDAAVPDDLRLVVVDAPVADRFDVVQTAHAEGAAEAVRYLLGLGHRTVHHLAGPTGSFSADERERGWREALAAAGAQTPEPLRGDWSAASGHARGVELPAEATAVFAANDQMALGLLRALAESGRPVPEEVSVVGFDDVMDAADYRPPLTTVRQDFDTLGACAVEVLVSRIETTGPPRLVSISAELVVRASSGPVSH
ncbi:LacI family DNA-binding transcriptional regulator [Microbacterium protaetiae]|uniref:LacI family DNA-binding transcriptional regulator n=2 Tax=Microbacterium protaetiae TaxID=2509458 RepID=A0A4P6EIH5_9MICO|nr:LacI family DNA-binding transcriptional regulator [Microbacterium protaetiae]QAY61806.1 LacI family DNA-binding transcriptional regulator [Microbacterium protaetiae]